MTYPASYHAAHSHIVAFGGHRFAQAGRRKVARALRDLRVRYHAGLISRDRLEWERGHFHYVGHPVKGTT